MTAVDVSRQLAPPTKLWRYLSLDKLVDLLSTRELLFVPLAFLVKSDPFEGYLPAAAMNALGELFRRAIPDIESAVRQFEKHFERTQRKLPNSAKEALQDKLEELKGIPKPFFQAIVQCQTVSCWHANEVESEAMWRLYADTGKGVAIETTVGALQESIQRYESPHRVHIYGIKYVDFFDHTLKPSDCVVEGQTTPLLKRLSYKHENEVRAFIGRIPRDPREAASIDYWRPAPIRLAADVNTLVQRVHVSPYTEEPLRSSVTRLCELFGLPKDIVEPSKLLSGQEQLLKPFEF